MSTALANPAKMIHRDPFANRVNAGYRTNLEFVDGYPLTTD